MLGWAVDGQPEIRDVPEPDLNRIASMNPDADMETAIANNYDVKYFEKKAGNLTSQYLIDSNQAQIQDAKDKAAKSLRNQYNTVLTGRDSLNAAVMALDVASVNLNTATAKRAVGEITELEYQNVLNRTDEYEQTKRLHGFVAGSRDGGGRCRRCAGRRAGSGAGGYVHRGHGPAPGQPHGVR